MKISFSKFYCRGVSHEKQRFGTIFLSAPKAPPPQKRKFYFYCRLAVSDVLQEPESEPCLSFELYKKTKSKPVPKGTVRTGNQIRSSRSTRESQPCPSRTCFLIILQGIP